MWRAAAPDSAHDLRFQGTGRYELAEYLIGKGADPNDDGSDPNNPEDDSTKKTPLHLAVQAGHFELVRWLVTMGRADPQLLDRNGSSPFHIACIVGHYRIAEWFVLGPARVDLNAKDYTGGTALSWARRQGHAKLATWLQDKAAGEQARVHGVASGSADPNGRSSASPAGLAAAGPAETSDGVVMPDGTRYYY